MKWKFKWILIILVIVLLLSAIGAAVFFFVFGGDSISEPDCADGEVCSTGLVIDGAEYVAFCEPVPDEVLDGLEPFADGSVFETDVELFELPDTTIEDGFGAVFAEESPACGGAPSHLYTR